MVRVTATFYARRPEEVPELGGWAHDAEFDPEEVTHDPQGQTVLVPFPRSPCGSSISPVPSSSGRGGWERASSRVPFVRCLLTIRQATALTARPSGQGEMGTMLLGLTYQPSEGVVQVDADWGPAFRVSVATVTTGRTAPSRLGARTEC